MIRAIDIHTHVIPSTFDSTSHSFRLGASLVWLAQGGPKRYPKDSGIGFFPAEIGVGLRLTDTIALAPLGRAGLFPVGGGLEFTAIEQDRATYGLLGPRLQAEF